ncbi:hypothetical protein [Polyangium sp. 15x6]|uniref:hypothetical protein n=1 Tax=Polyangium sp. 15x6 TaxID=3042687 RepID=UPI00249B9790|nr:hypothetical protein [Polyangium sp. 15x6]MDI3285161.1 hypothetical protein [Polyangium sp. 15x6]
MFYPDENYPYVSAGGDIVMGGDPFLDQVLQPVSTAGPEIFVGAPVVDPDIAALTNLVQTSGWGNVAVGGPDILVGAPYGAPYFDESVIFTGAPVPRQLRFPMRANPQQQLAAQQAQQQQLAAQQAQTRALQQQNAALKAQLARAQQAPATRPVGTPARVEEVGREKYRKIPLPISSNGDVLANQTMLVTARPQMMAKPYRLVIENSQWWRIRDVKVGNKSQFIAAGTLPGVLFSPDAMDVTLVGDTAQVSQDIIIEVENKTGADHKFEGALICHVVD